MNTKYFFAVVFYSLFAIVPSMARADLLAQQPDCTLFSDVNMTGLHWTAQVGGKDEFSPLLGNLWNQRAASVYVRDGFVLEVYSEPYFAGTSVSLSRGAEGSSLVADGVSVNLSSVSIENVASYRCRKATGSVDTPFGRAPWTDGGDYYWFSGGNHYDQKSLKMQTVDGHAILKVHSDNTYRINEQDYDIDLTAGVVKVSFKSLSGTAGSAEFSLDLGAFRSDFRIMVDELVDTLKVLAKGYHYACYDAVAPPVPEVLQVASYVEGVVAPRP